MSYALIFTDSYKKRAKRFAQKHPELKEPYRKTLQLLAYNPYHPSLRIHPLTKLCHSHKSESYFNYPAFPSTLCRQ